MKQCPFCGEKKIETQFNDRVGFYTAMCMHCCAQGPCSGNRDGAEFLWDTRAKLKAVPMIPPTSGEAWIYAGTIGMGASECSKFFDYFESNGWKVGRNPMKDWKSAMRVWARKAGEMNPSARRVSAAMQSIDKALREAGV